MANPPINSIVFTDTAIICIADKNKYTFPYAGSKTDAVPVPFVDLQGFATGLVAAIKSAVQDAVTQALAGQATPGQTTAPVPVNAPPTPFQPGWTDLTLGTQDNIGAAVAVAGKGFNLKLQPGHYKQAFDIPDGLDGWTISSTTNKASDVTIDGQGGATKADNDAGRGDTRLAWGKGVVHARSPGKLVAVTVTGGGTKAAPDHDGQAGLYWEASNGNCIAERCRFTGNENGVFTNSTGRNVQFILDHCGFDNNGNGDGGSHDTYVNGDATSSLTLIECWAEGSNQGNDFKSRIPKVTVQGGYFGSKNNNRWLDCADGATLDIKGGLFVGSDTGQNIFANGSESTSKGPGNTTWDGSTIYLGNRMQNFDNAGTFQGTNLTVYSTGDGSNITNAHGGPLNGLQIGGRASPPAPPPVPYE